MFTEITSKDYIIVCKQNIEIEKFTLLKMLPLTFIETSEERISPTPPSNPRQ